MNTVNASAVLGIGGEGGRQGPAAAREAAAPPAASSKLEISAHNRTCLNRRVVIKPYRCNCRICGNCAGRYGSRVRTALLLKHDLFLMPALLTLTVNRDNFESPEDAHRFVMDNGLLRRMMRFLGVVNWVWVLEFQGASGTGWPHWHILVDLSTLPGHRLDLDRAWHLWRDKYEIGGLQLEVRRDFKTATDAILYATKYLTKRPPMGFPFWVRNSTRLRFFAASTAVGPLLTKQRDNASASTAEGTENAVKTCKPTGQKRIERTLAQREAACGMSSMALIERRDGITGEARYEYLGPLPSSTARLMLLSKLGRLRTPIGIEHRSAEFGNNVSEWIEPYLADPKKSPQDQFNALRDELEAMDERIRTINQIEDRIRLADANSKWIGRTDEPSAPAPAEAPDDLPL